MGDLSENFSTSEFRCKCGRCDENGDHIVAAPRLITALQALRSLVSAPIRVNSGFRCPAHNRAVGGSIHSQHLYGKAADIVIHGLSVLEMYEQAQRIPSFKKGGVGIYPAESFVHVDVRGRKARWGRIEGLYVGIDEAIKSMNV